MRVLYLLTTLDVGGTERSLLEVLRQIDRARVQPVVCSLISGGRLRQAYAALDIPVFELGVDAGFREAWAIRLVSLLMRCRPAIVHSRLILSNLWARLGPLSGARVICEERGLADERPRFMTWLNRATQPLCSMNVANSEAVAARMRSRDRIRDARLRVIYGGVDCSVFTPAEAGSVRFDLVTTTRLEPYKGVTDLIEAMHLVQQQRPGTSLSIVGDGSQRNVIETRVRQLGPRAEVKLWGDQADVPSRLREGRLFVLSSHEEGLPNAVLEAMACGLPTIATCVGGTPELVVHGETGMLVQPRDPPALADAILRYLQAPQLVEAHGVAARKRAETRFDIRTTARAYEQLYCELLS